MSLLQLPTELLVQVIDYVGPYYFRQDVRRLTVCKAWLAIARNTMVRSLYLSETDLERLFSSSNVGKDLALIRSSTQALDIRLPGFEYKYNISENRSPTPDTGEDSDVDEIWDLAERMTLLNAKLSQLGVTAKDSRKLRILRIEALEEQDMVFPSRTQHNLLNTTTIQAFLAPRNLAVLDLDLCCAHLVKQSGEEEDTHICQIIAPLLSTLQRLRLRMRKICPDVLKLRPQDTITQLGEVIINLSLSDSEFSMLGPPEAISSRCGSCRFSGSDVKKLEADIVDQAAVIANYMVPYPTVRVLGPDLPQSKLHSLDVVTGKRMLLDIDALWDDDGETIASGSSAGYRSESDSDF